MALQLFPQLSFGGSLSGGSGSAQVEDGIVRALRLEQLGEARAKRKQREGQEAATKTATEAATTRPRTMESESGLTLNLGTESKPFDVDQFQTTYAQELAKVSPEAAQNYQMSVSQHKELTQKLESDALTLEQAKKAQPLKLALIHQDAMARAWDYGKATNWQDKPGVLSMLNPYEDPKDKTVDIQAGKNGVTFIQADGDKIPVNDAGMQSLMVGHDTQLKEWNEMVRFWNKEGKDSAKVVARAPQKTELDDALKWVSQNPTTENMDKAEIKTLAGDMAREILSIQTEQKNKKETPMSYDDARQAAWDKLSRRVLPGQETDWFDLKMDRPARYFTNKESVDAALENHDITKSEHSKVMELGFSGANAPKEKNPTSSKLPSDASPIAKDKKGEIVYFQPSTNTYFYKDGTKYTP